MGKALGPVIPVTTRAHGPVPQHGGGRRPGSRVGGLGRRRAELGQRPLVHQCRSRLRGIARAFAASVCGSMPTAPLHQPAAQPATAMSGLMTRYAELPQLAVDGQGTPWLVFRHWTIQQPTEMFHVYAMKLTAGLEHALATGRQLRPELPMDEHRPASRRQARRGLCQRRAFAARTCPKTRSTP